MTSRPSNVRKGSIAPFRAHTERGSFTPTIGLASGGLGVPSRATTGLMHRSKEHLDSITDLFGQDALRLVIYSLPWCQFLSSESDQ
jgi:hypothetical protein